jgi:L-ribulose-5-phosphate 3-epimerase
MYHIGLMQGRLVPQVKGRIQAFPREHWQEEFGLAQKYGFTSIEFIFEADGYTENPLFSSSGRAQIRDVIQRSHVPVSAICADYFMDRPFFGVSETVQWESVELLRLLIDTASEIGAQRVEIPCVDHAAIHTEEDKQRLQLNVSQALPLAESRGVEIVFETSLPPTEFREFLERFHHPLVRANYDSGNSASLGFDPVEEITILGEMIGNIHIKDRLLHGTTVPLGKGNANFSAIFSTLAAIRYKGPFILQTARDPDHIGAAVRYRDMVCSFLGQFH